MPDLTSLQVSENPDASMPPAAEGLREANADFVSDSYPTCASIIGADTVSNPHKDLAPGLASSLQPQLSVTVESEV